MDARRTVGLWASTLLVVTSAAGAGAAPAAAAPPATSEVTGTPSAMTGVSSAAAGRAGRSTPKVLGYQHLVVIYQENHSFDNLYGSWGRVGKNRVEGLSKADPASTTQVRQDGTPYACLPQNDVNLTSPPLPSTCTDPQLGAPSAFTNRPFSIDDLIAPTDTTCPEPGVSSTKGTLKGTGRPGGCTRDLVHRFYQEKYQIDGGKQDRYVTGSDAVGLTMGYYDTKELPIYTYLHSAGAPHYVVADHFFQGANGGSFLNHQWLVAGRAPFADPAGPLPEGLTEPKTTVVDANGMPTAYDQYTPTRTDVVNGQLTVACPDPTKIEDYAHACGRFAVNTVQPASAPFEEGDPGIPLIDDDKYPNIGDRMSAKGISWAWYAGGWDDAEAGHPGELFQYHHQPFNYFADYAKGKPARAHLQDETDFLNAAAIGNLPTVSFVKPYGAENEHPGYASASTGSDHLVDLLKAVTSGPEADDTLVVVTYDEFGGQWDHVPPPGKGSPTKGAYDAFGPGTRIPALVLSSRMRRSGVDHTSYDTTSIIRTLERSLHLHPVGIRDTEVADLRKAVRKGKS
jgi:acid phosphatase